MGVVSGNFFEHIINSVALVISQFTTKEETPPPKKMYLRSLTLATHSVF